MTVVADKETVSETTELSGRIDTLITRTEQMLALTTEGRTMFSANEVMDLALDCRTALVEARQELITA